MSRSRPDPQYNLLVESVVAHALYSQPGMAFGRLGLFHELARVTAEGSAFQRPRRNNKLRLGPAYGWHSWLGLMFHYLLAGSHTNPET